MGADLSSILSFPSSRLGLKELNVSGGRTIFKFVISFNFGSSSPSHSRAVQLCENFTLHCTMCVPRVRTLGGGMGGVPGAVGGRMRREFAGAGRGGRNFSCGKVPALGSISPALRCDFHETIHSQHMPRRLNTVTHRVPRTIGQHSPALRGDPRKHDTLNACRQFLHF